jgi:hypothetical protein
MVPAMASVRVAGGLAATLLLTLSSVVLAQGAPPAGPASDPAAPAADGKEVEMEEEPAVDPSGVEENPTDPITGEPVEEPGAPPPVRARRSGYPAQEVLRPITLPALTSEVGLDLRTLVGDFSVDFNLRGRFGITRQWQIGLGYNVGGLYDDGAKFRFNTGTSRLLKNPCRRLQPTGRAPCFQQAARSEMTSRMLLQHPARLSDQEPGVGFGASRLATVSTRSGGTRASTASHRAAASSMAYGAGAPSPGMSRLRAGLPPSTKQVEVVGEASTRRTSAQRNRNRPTTSSPSPSTWTRTRQTGEAR